MNEPKSSLELAVVIATKDRPELLKKRALASVIMQTRRPNYLMVVDDSSPLTRPHIREIVGSLRLSNCNITYIENKRTEGASGSWNTAFERLSANIKRPEMLYIAILDDDDAWSPTYLQECFAAVCNRELDMVATALHRIEKIGDTPLLNEAPPFLQANDFLVGNPGIQGSNLFLRLSVLLAAGGFDEALRSTTDRDLCIRIADLKNVRYGRLPVALVDHYAESDRTRLSSRGSAAKIEGLSAFWKKYAGRMTLEQRRVFSARATELFGWPAQIEPNLTDSQVLIEAPFRKNVNSQCAPKSAPFTLYIGVITSEPATLRPLLQSLLPLQNGAIVKSLVVLILDNGSPKDELVHVIRDARQSGIKTAVVSEPRQRQDTATGAFGTPFQKRPNRQVGIAYARTMLQRYLGVLLTLNQNSFGWLLDDDMRIDERALDYLSWLPAFQKQGVDVLIGTHEGSSPNPPLNGLRVNLVDLFHNLLWLRNLSSDTVLPDRSSENAAMRSRFPDYYYDLSRKHTGHLEMPLWLEPATQGETVGEAYFRLTAGSLKLLSGKSLTRSITVKTPLNPLETAHDSVNRGGNTFILNPQALTLTPNTITRVNGREARRSDMIWAIVNRSYRKLSLKTVDFPVLHIGRTTEMPSLNAEKVQAEIVGSTLYAGITDFLSSRPHHELNFSSQEIEQIVCLAEHYLERRLQAMKQSFFRIAGLRDAIRAVARPGELNELLNHLDHWFTETRFQQILSGVGKHDESDVRDFLASLRTIADDFAAAWVNTDFIDAQLRYTRFSLNT